MRNLVAAVARWTVSDDKNMLELQASAGIYTHLGASTREFLSEVESMIALPRSFFVQPFGKNLSARRLHC